MKEWTPDNKAHGMRRTIWNFYNHFLTVTAAFACILTLALTVMIGQEVVMRYFFGRPSSWTVDVSGYVMLTLTFVGAAWVLKKEGHVSVDIMVTRFGKRAREIIDGIMSIAGALVCLLFTYVSFMASVEAYSAATMLVGGILFPKYIPLAIMAFGMFLLSVQFLVRSWLCFSGQRTV